MMKLKFTEVSEKSSSLRNEVHDFYQQELAKIVQERNQELQVRCLLHIYFI